VASLPDFSAVRAVFMDLDDTLCAYWDASKAGLRKAFEEHPVEGRSLSEMLDHWAAAFRDFSKGLKESEYYAAYLKSGEVTRTELMRRTLARMGVENPEHAARLSEAYMRNRDRFLTLFPEALGFLERLRGKYPLGLITNGPADIQRQEIATLGIEPFFDHIFIEGEMGEGKPLLSVFRRAEAAVGLPPGALVFIGNSYHHDIRPAIEAGWRTVWVRRPSDVPPSASPGQSGPEDRPEGAPEPDLEVGSLDEIPL
jgi:putative hydrolase of the HAD superfamily